MCCFATGPRRPRDEPLPDKLGRGAPEGEAWGRAASNLNRHSVVFRRYQGPMDDWNCSQHAVACGRTLDGLTFRSEKETDESLEFVIEVCIWP
jgi:hypothetical protein